eukprot:CAMPEP_0177780502 /NCGR_PEP_ID=MMETSP0491_2-20121128/17241_1 /TAXON_ID=63592 /ORGANISM="Tetraselmis chuii, Strain PLY429" /LENGTH=148 /DNA_ID=CAMNT_0019300285 /DNA_START=313 /DNA_END=756 /DNA_ORIENTATION=+
MPPTTTPMEEKTTSMSRDISGLADRTCHSERLASTSDVPKMVEGPRSTFTMATVCSLGDRVLLLTETEGFLMTGSPTNCEELRQHSVLALRAVTPHLACVKTARVSCCLAAPALLATPTREETTRSTSPRDAHISVAGTTEMFSHLLR